MDAKREMTLDEWVGTLPPIHGARTELDTLRRQLAAEQERRRQIDDEAYEYAEQLQAAESKLALAEQGARRYRWWRKNAVWSQELDGFVRWIAFIAMPEPPMDVDTLTPDSVAECLDAGVDAAIAAGQGKGD